MCVESLSQFPKPGDLVSDPFSSSGGTCHIKLFTEIPYGTAESKHQT